MEQTKQKYIEGMSLRLIAMFMVVFAEIGMIGPVLVSAASNISVLLGFGSLVLAAFIVWKLTIGCLNLTDEYRKQINQLENEENA